VVVLGVAVTTWPLVLRPGAVPFAPGSAFTDLLVSHLPYVEFLRDSLAETGAVPLWNPLILGGLPFAADPLAGLWYPPTWLLVALPLPLGFNLLWLAHLAWGGLGVRALLRALGASPWPALLGALAFAGMPKLAAHIAAGHVSLVCAVAWTPWALLGVRRAAVQGGWRAGTVAGAAVAVATLADVRWGAYTAITAAAYWLATLRGERHKLGTDHGRRRLAAVAAALGVALLLVAGLALPLAELLPYTDRTRLTVAEAGGLSLPWHYLLGLVIPPLGGFHEYMVYVGIVPLLLALAGLRRANVFWAGLALVAAAFALGTNFGFYPLAFRFVPGVAWLRVPARAWFLVGLSVAVLAGLGAEWIRAIGLPALAKRWDRPRLAVWGCARLVPVLALLSVADLARVNGTLLVLQPRPEAVPAAGWLSTAADDERFRIFSPSYSLPAGDGLEHLDGVSPLQIAAVAQAINAAAGTRPAGYSVTVPPFEGDPATANAWATPNAEALGLFNVGYVAAEFPLTAPGLELAATFGRTHLYRNTRARPRAWVETPPGERPASLIDWSPNAIEIRATGPGRLVVSEVAYPGWTAIVDGQPAELETAHAVLRAVTLASGEHSVRLVFRPLSVYLGAGLSALGWLGLLAAAVARPRRAGP
jgi:hypothetical protein